MLSFLNQALKGERGTALAAQIQAQFPFAMIDEFQDTDKEQYEIFHKILCKKRMRIKDYYDRRPETVDL
ncbi:exodeoxyribonuclease V subunit beta [Actinobacillus equuli]|nr:exodeoxyribonuclease V subunit beta [Actinobacillus equuli]